MVGLFVCEHCKRIGPWDLLERFIEPKKTKKASEEIKQLKKSIKTLPDFSKQWDEVKKTSESVDKMTSETYSHIMEKFSLSVI